eukprot:15338868-Ditylum_brightwellii.AAC.1
MCAAQKSMVDTVQTSVETAISPSVNSKVHMENIIKKSRADKIAHILPGIISTTLKELHITKPITSNIDTSNSVMISTITGEGNITMTLKDNTAKKVLITLISWQLACRPPHLKTTLLTQQERMPMLKRCLRQH